jgi:hypothetical protein
MSADTVQDNHDRLFSIAESLRSSLNQAVVKRAATCEWRTEHPTTTGTPEQWVRDELCEEWRKRVAEMDAYFNEVNLHRYQPMSRHGGVVHA